MGDRSVIRPTVPRGMMPRGLPQLNSNPSAKSVTPAARGVAFGSTAGAAAATPATGAQQPTGTAAAVATAADAPAPPKSDAEVLAEARTRVVSKWRGPILFTAPHGIELVRDGWPNHAPERHTSELAKLLADLCVVDGVAGSYMHWNLKRCRPGDARNLDPNYLTEQMYGRSPFHVGLEEFKAYHRMDRYEARRQARAERVAKLAGNTAGAVGGASTPTAATGAAPPAAATASNSKAAPKRPARAASASSSLVTSAVTAAAQRAKAAATPTTGVGSVSLPVLSPASQKRQLSAAGSSAQPDSATPTSASASASASSNSTTVTGSAPTAYRTVGGSRPPLHGAGGGGGGSNRSNSVAGHMRHTSAETAAAAAAAAVVRRAHQRPTPLVRSSSVADVTARAGPSATTNASRRASGNASQGQATAASAPGAVPAPAWTASSSSSSSLPAVGSKVAGKLRALAAALVETEQQTAAARAEADAVADSNSSAAEAPDAAAAAARARARARARASAQVQARKQQLWLRELQRRADAGVGTDDPSLTALDDVKQQPPSNDGTGDGEPPLARKPHTVTVGAPDSSAGNGKPQRAVGGAVPQRVVAASTSASSAIIGGGKLPRKKGAGPALAFGSALPKDKDARIPRPGAVASGGPVQPPLAHPYRRSDFDRKTDAPAPRLSAAAKAAARQAAAAAACAAADELDGAHADGDSGRRSSARHKKSSSSSSSKAASASANAKKLEAAAAELAARDPTLTDRYAPLLHIDLHGRTEKRELARPVVEVGAMPLRVLRRDTDFVARFVRTFGDRLRVAVAAGVGFATGAVAAGAIDTEAVAAAVAAATASGQVLGRDALGVVADAVSTASGQSSGYDVDTDPQLSAFWGTDRRTMTEQSVQLGVVSVQVEMTPSFRSELATSFKLRRRVAAAIVSVYRDLLVTYNPRADAVVRPRDTIDFRKLTFLKRPVPPQFLGPVRPDPMDLPKPAEPAVAAAAAAVAGAESRPQSAAPAERSAEQDDTSEAAASSDGTAEARATVSATAATNADVKTSGAPAAPVAAAEPDGPDGGDEPEPDAAPINSAAGTAANDVGADDSDRYEDDLDDADADEDADADAAAATEAVATADADNTADAANDADVEPDAAAPAADGDDDETPSA